MVYPVVVFLQRANCSKMLKYSKCNVILNSEPDKNKIKVRSKISLHSPYIAYIGPVILLFYPTFNCFEPVLEGMVSKVLVFALLPCFPDPMLFVDS